MIEIKVSYDHDADYARDACRWWAALSLTPEEKTGVEDPIEMERLADAAADRAHTRFIVSDDPERGRRADRARTSDLGFTHLVFHAPGEDQRRFLEQFCADVVPLLALAAARDRELRLVGEPCEHLQLELAERLAVGERRRRGSPSGPGRA